jgi:hypothetical protein
MDLENIIYPGFNKSLSELKAISKIKKKSCEIVDLTEIEWVRDVLKHRIDEIGDFKIKFNKATEDEIQYVSKLVGADIDPEELKNNFHKNKRIIGITSGKGGVGKSTITSLLGLAFDEMGKKLEYWILIFGVILFQRFLEQNFHQYLSMKEFSPQG